MSTAPPPITSATTPASPNATGQRQGAARNAWSIPTTPTPAWIIRRPARATIVAPTERVHARLAPSALTAEARARVREEALMRVIALAALACALVLAATQAPA